MRWTFPLVAGMMFLAIAALSLWLAEYPVDISPIKPGPSPVVAMTAQASETAGATAFGDLSETMARPLFSPTRRTFQPQPIELPVVPEPSVVAEAEAPVEASPAAEVPTLLGVNIGGNGNAALLHWSSAPNPAWYREGADIGGWTIAKIDRNSAIFVGGDRREIRKLYNPDAFRAP